MTTVDRIAEPWGSRTPYGRVRARLRISGIREGVLFLPFHYGYWDTPGGCAPQERDGRAANELTMTDWDPVSKQPLFKTAAARLSLVERGDGAAAPAPPHHRLPPGRLRGPGHRRRHGRAGGRDRGG